MTPPPLERQDLDALTAALDEVIVIAGRFDAFGALALLTSALAVAAIARGVSPDVVTSVLLSAGWERAQQYIDELKKGER